MFKNTFQSGFLSILYSLGSKPLQIWTKKVRAFLFPVTSSATVVYDHFRLIVKLRFYSRWHPIVNGHVKRPQDEDIQSNVLEIIGSNIQSTYITCPADPAATLGIKLPFLVLIVKNLMKYFTFEIQVLDDKNVRRRFRASNFQFNLADFTKRAYGTNYVETLQVQVHANCRLRRIYFSDRLYSEEELPPEFKLYLPMQVRL
ncbi:Cilia- and flagella-associated protein 20 [Glycine soja]